MKNRSPRVVANHKNPFRITVGDLSSQTVIPITDSMIIEKNIAVGTVHAIHDKIYLPLFLYELYAAKCKAAG